MDGLIGTEIGAVSGLLGLILKRVAPPRYDLEGREAIWCIGLSKFKKAVIEPRIKPRQFYISFGSNSRQSWFTLTFPASRSTSRPI
jgi:hypothetical protein